MMNRPLVLPACLLLAASSACASSWQREIPEPPDPPTPPPHAAEAYYSTCGGTHPPAKYTLGGTAYAGSDEYGEVFRYAQSPEFVEYMKKFQEYRTELARFNGMYGWRMGGPLPVPRTPADLELLQSAGALEKEKEDTAAPTTPPPSTREAPAESADAAQAEVPEPVAPAETVRGILAAAPKRYLGFQTDNGQVVRGPQSGLEGGANAQHIERDPKQDLAQWFRGFLYHQSVVPADYNSGAEDAVGLGVSDAGPAPANGLYGRLRAFLPKDGAEPPRPAQMLAGLEAFWKARWRPALGFDADPYNKQLLADAAYARKLAAAANKRLNDLQRSAGQDPDAGTRLKAALASAQRDLDAARAKEEECSDTLFRRLQFVQAMVELLRLAPRGGFGPEFESADLDVVQHSAARILAELGALAGAVAWQGLGEDLAWLDEHDSDRNSVEYARRVRGMNACEALLADPRVEGLSAVCDFLAARNPAAPEVLRKAFELVDRFGTQRLRAEVLNVLPRLLELARASESAVAGRARHLVLRILKVRGGGASMEAAIGTLAPLTVSKDAELARAALGFLQGNTGMTFGAEPKKWQALEAEMKQKRLAGR